MAPEMINICGFNYVTNQKSHKLFSSNGYHGAQSDVFALGVILFSLLMGRPPFKIADINDPLYRLIFTHQIKEFWAPWDQFAAQSNFEIPQDFKDLFIAMVTFNPVMRLSVNEILSSKWMQRQIPKHSEVLTAMTSIKAKLDEIEDQQKLYIEQMMKQKAVAVPKNRVEEIKQEAQLEEQDNLNDSCLSAGSHIQDDEAIMKDLQEIEKKFCNDDMEGNDSFNLEDDEAFDVGSFTNSKEFDLGDDEAPEEETMEDRGEATNVEKSSTVTQDTHQDRASSILHLLNNIPAVDTEVRTTVPDKMISFLDQYANIKGWKLVKISNYILMKIPESSDSIVEYAIKFDEVEEARYSLKFLQYDEMPYEQFQAVGNFILNLLRPYC